MSGSDRIPIADAAYRLAMTYHQVRTLLFRRKLRGGKDEFGRFYVDARDLERFASTRSKRQTERKGAAG